MARWIEVPAHRVLELTDEEFDLNYEALNVEGQPLRFGETAYRIQRKSDGKLFMHPRFHAFVVDRKRLVYIEEI